jgi:hypothetical protein
MIFVDSLLSIESGIKKMEILSKIEGRFFRKIYIKTVV